MITEVVLDAAAFDVLDGPHGKWLHWLLDQAGRRGGNTWCAAVTLAEVCRGAARTRHVEGVLRRGRDRPRIKVVPTDEGLAKIVGAILHDTSSGSEHLADAHVVALCAALRETLVITSDAGELRRLAATVPSARIAYRRPDGGAA